MLPEWNEEDELKLNKALEGEEIEEEKPEEEITPEPEPEKPIEEPAPEKPEVKPEPEVLDNQAFARLRIEAKTARDEKEKLQREIEELKNPPKPIPSKEEDIAEHIIATLGITQKDLTELKTWKENQEKEKQAQASFSNSVNAFKQFEAAYKAKTDDYEDVATHFKSKLSESIRTLNPTLSNDEVETETVRQTLIRASLAAQQGLDPAETLYKQGKSLGYTPKKVEPEQKSNLEIIANNKKKSTNMLGSSGSGGKPEHTLQSVANAPLSEMKKLSEAELDALIYGT